jgi:predicted RND superfamily exporter protein
MTGMPALSYDDMTSGFEDMGYGSIFSLVAVFTLLVLAFRMWTSPILAITNLMMGITWTMGFIALTIGRLNMFTLMFAIILIGLGIDFAIHMNATFSMARSQGMSIREAVREMYGRAGAGVVTGAVTTSAAFFAMTLTGLDALVELGLVLGTGILLTLLASLTVLPAMFVIHARVGERRRKGKEIHAKPVRLSFPFLGKLGELVGRRPWPVLIAFAAITAALVVPIRGAEFEGDMLEILPQERPSITLHRDIQERFELNPDYVMITSKSLEETRPIVKRLKKNRLVGRVDAITDLVPSEKEQRKRARIVAGIRERMEEVGKGPHDQVTEEQAKRFLDELGRLQLNVVEIGQLAFTSVKLRLKRACDGLSGGEDEKFSRILALKKRLEGTDDLARRLADYQRAYVPRLAAKLARMADTSPIAAESLPENIRERYMSAEGNNLVTVYASVNLWQGDAKDLFLAAMEKATERVTGSIILMDKLITLVGSRGFYATVLSLGAVFLILLIDFRHLGYALLGMMPLVVGFAWMVGLFVITGWKFDLANVMGFPLILGIGIDDAVHVLHAVRRQGTGAMPDVLRHTGRALLLTSLTTGIAFGSIATASHVGMAGIGMLLALGVASCFVASVVLLPALMRIFLKEGESNSKNKEAANV